MFKVGQKVHCETYGEGVVMIVMIVDAGANESYPVVVQFLSGWWECYTEDGMIHEEDDEPSLTVIEE